MNRKSQTLAFVTMILLSGQAFAQSRQDEVWQEEVRYEDWYEEKKEEKSQWAPSATFLAGKFNTDQSSQLIENITDYEVNFTGRSWDIGVTHGRPGHSYSRISYAEVRYDNGSWADDGFRKFTTDSVMLKGIKFEKLWRLGPSRWPIAPMISIHGGVGKVSGQVTSAYKYYGWDPALLQWGWITKTETGPVRNLRYLYGFDSEWYPFGGLGIGATGEIFDFATVTVAVYGLEIPGTYKGSIQITYWPWRHRY